ncbi:ankyrin repeat-containing domain protein, partial [Kalaharituber pfeilii]
GKTPLHYAAEVHNNESTVRLLLDHSDIDINLADKDGKTPLHCAVERRSKSTVRLLLDHSDIDINLADKDGKTPLHYAAE